MSNEIDYVIIPRKSGYGNRCHHQIEQWFRGIVEHNIVDDECCPDFSCCVPELFESDRSKRLLILNKFRVSRGLPEHVDS